MSFTDTIGDMISRIRNAHARGKNIVITPSSKIKINLASLLKDKGYNIARRTIAK